MCLNQHVEFCQKTVMAEKGVGCSSQHLGVGPLVIKHMQLFLNHSLHLWQSALVQKDPTP